MSNPEDAGENIGITRSPQKMPHTRCPKRRNPKINLQNPVPPRQAQGSSRDHRRSPQTRPTRLGNPPPTRKDQAADEEPLRGARGLRKGKCHKQTRIKVRLPLEKSHPI